MEDYPSYEIWNQRRIWINAELENANNYEVDCSDHSVTLFFDMAISFCAGAWTSVIVMSVSVIDAHLRECYAIDNKLATAKLLTKYYKGQNIDWLRKLRNSYVHCDPDNTVFEMNAHFENAEKMEADARKAMQMTISALFQV